MLSASDVIWRGTIWLRARRAQIKGGLRLLFLFALLAFFIPLAWNLLRGFDRNVSMWEAPTTARISAYASEMEMRVLKIDLMALTASGSSTFTVRETRDLEDLLEIVSFAYRPEKKAPYIAASTEKLEGHPNALNLRVTSDAQTGLGIAAADFDASLPLLELRGPAQYPFDEYAMSVAVRASVGRGAVKDNLASPSKFRITLADRLFQIDEDKPSDTWADGEVFHYKLHRPFYLQWVAAWVGVFLLGMLAYLMSLSDTKDLMLKAAGYFGTMWAFRQLLIPSFLPIFPTFIDLYILTLFAVLFCAVTYRFAIEQLEGVR